MKNTFELDKKDRNRLTHEFALESNPKRPESEWDGGRNWIESALSNQSTQREGEISSNRIPSSSKLLRNQL
jgi:hypothetical protein